MKSKKIIMLTAGILLLGGITIAGAAAAMGALTKTGPVLQTKSFSSEGIFKIDIDLSVDDIYITTKDTSEIKVTYYTGKTKDYRISTEDGVFTMQTMPASELNKRWYDYIDINFRNTGRVTVELPKDLAPEFDLHTDYGDIKATNLQGTVHASASAGDIELERSAFLKLECVAEFGDIDLEDVSADVLSADNSCGDIDFKNIISNSMRFSCQFGDISGTIDAAKSEFTISAKTEFGDCNLSNQANGLYDLTAENECGDIKIKFNRP